MFIQKAIAASTGAIAISTAKMASAGTAYVPISEPTNSDGSAGLILLLLVGAIVVLNGVGTGRAKDTQSDAQDDDDVLMRF